MVRSKIAAAGGDPDSALLRWELFTLALDSADPAAPGVGDVLLVPPLSGFRDESDALEEVHFLRDEGANMVWGVEHRVMNALGRPVDGFDAQRQRAATIRQPEPPAPHAPQSGVPIYRLASTVPDNWIPFIPASATPFLGLSHPSIRLRRAQMLRTATDEIPAMSRLLSLTAPDPLLWMEEASVLRSGVRFQLTAQRARWVDGKTYVWLGRKVLVGGGEGSSGLRFDVLRESPP